MTNTVDKEEFDKLINRVKWLEDRQFKIDRDENLVKEGFTVNGNPPLGAMIVAKYFKDNVMTEQFFENYAHKTTYYPYLTTRIDIYPYAWKEIKCKQKKQPNQ